MLALYKSPPIESTHSTAASYFFFYTRNGGSATSPTQSETISTITGGSSEGPTNHTIPGLIVLDFSPGCSGHETKVDIARR